MAYIKFNTDSGVLLQISDYEMNPYDSETVTTVSLPKIALETEYVWDSSLRDFVAKVYGRLTKLEFLRKFTAAERIQIREAAKVDPIIFDAMDLLDLAEFISLQDQDTMNLVGYLAQQGILQPARVMEILG